MKDASTLQRAMREPRAPSRRQQLFALALWCRPLGPWGGNRPHLAFVRCNMILPRADVNAPRVSRNTDDPRRILGFPLLAGLDDVGEEEAGLSFHDGFGGRERGPRPARRRTRHEPGSSRYRHPHRLTRITAEIAAATEPASPTDIGPGTTPATRSPDPPTSPPAGPRLGCVLRPRLHPLQHVLAARRQSCRARGAPSRRGADGCKCDGVAIHKISPWRSNACQRQIRPPRRLPLPL